MTPETEALIARVLAHDAAMTKGPFRFEVNRKSRNVKLCGGEPKFDVTVIDLKRWGMDGADFRFRDVNGLMHPSSGLCKAIPGREHHADWCATIAHPDAVGIEDFRTDAPKLARMLKQAIGALCLTATVKDSGGALTALRETTLTEIEKIAREGK